MAGGNAISRTPHPPTDRLCHVPPLLALVMSLTLAARGDSSEILLLTESRVDKSGYRRRHRESGAESRPRAVYSSTGSLFTLQPFLARLVLNSWNIMLDIGVRKNTLFR